MLKLPDDGTWLGRVWNPQVQGPSIVTLRNGLLVDITSTAAPLVSDIMEMASPSEYVNKATGEVLGNIDDIAQNDANDQNNLHFLAPCDLQAIKACGVTFANSMIERVIEERAAGDANKAHAIRQIITAKIGTNLSTIVPGSKQAEAAKQALIEEGLWSQYLEVGIGPDAEVFTKAPVLAAVGYGADIGLHPVSNWNNPEPEVVLAVSSSGQIVGASLGNDVNLRDVEGRSALLLGKAKDNNASAVIGPMIRLFDDSFNLEDVCKLELQLEVKGKDGFHLQGYSCMQAISRQPQDLVAQTIGTHHQYPDGLMLFLGTLFAPTQDRGQAGAGFTHHLDDQVTISCPQLGTLSNRVQLATECQPWTFGIRQLMANLSNRGLL